MSFGLEVVLLVQNLIFEKKKTLLISKNSRLLKAGFKERKLYSLKRKKGKIKI